MFHVLLTSYEIVGKHLYELCKLVGARMFRNFESFEFEWGGRLDGLPRKYVISWGVQGHRHFLGVLWHLARQPTPPTALQPPRGLPTTTTTTTPLLTTPHLTPPAIQPPPRRLSQPPHPTRPPATSQPPHPNCPPTTSQPPILAPPPPNCPPTTSQLPIPISQPQPLPNHLSTIQRNRPVPPFFLTAGLGGPGGG